MSILAAAAGLLCLLFVRDRRPEGVVEGAVAKPIATTEKDWTFREAVLTPQFMITAAAMVLTEACVTTVHSAAISHLAKLGNTAVFAAYMLSLQSMMATIAKGAAGTLSDYLAPKYLLAIGLVIECLGMVLLAHAGAHEIGYGFAIAFGVGWGTAYLAVTVLLINYFGPNTGSSLLSTVWLLTVMAAAGPAVAGLVADRSGSYSTVFSFGGVILLPIAFGVLVMRAPHRPAAAAAAAVMASSNLAATE
jgi:MFS family permease